MRPDTFRPAVLATAGLLVVACIGATASAQTCGLKNHMRLVNRVNSGTAQELRLDTGWQQTGPLETPGAASDSSPYGTTSGSWVSTSDYGSLAFSGSATGTNAPGNGIFMWCDEWIGGEPKAWFKDRLTVVSASLPAGTPVTIRASGYLAGTAGLTDPSGEHSYSASFSGDVFNLQWTNSEGEATQDFVIQVGSFRDIQGRLWCTLRDNRLLGGAVYSDSLYANLHASVNFTVLTPGASISWCSGATYAGCLADLGAAGGTAGHDGSLDNNDFIAFINDFFASDPRADLGAAGGVQASDGLFNNNDFIAFITLFFAGC